MGGVAEFEHHFIDNDCGYDGIGAMVVADFDGDGRPEFAIGGKGGGFYHIYDLDPADGRWTCHVVTNDFSPNVGAAAADLDGDGRLELICGEWGSRLMHIIPPEHGLGGWTCHVVGDGLSNPHDVLAADIDGDGRDEIIVRQKDGSLVIYRPQANLAGPWPAQTIAEYLPGDGTTVAAITGRGLDIITNAGWFENVNGDGSQWVRHPLMDEKLNWHGECRIAAGDLDGSGRISVVITESEIDHGRLALLTPAGQDKPWSAQILLDRDLNMCALHSLQLVDLTGDGRLDIFTAEMENGKSDGVTTRPKWWRLTRSNDSQWTAHVLLDANLGTHSASVADFDGDGLPDIVGKVWRANAVNGADGKNHVDFLHNISNATP